MKFYGDISSDGKLSLYDRDYFVQYIKSMSLSSVELTIKEKSNRSTQQNRYYWGAVIPIIREGMKRLGIVMNSEQVHELLKYKFLIHELVTNDGDVIKTIGSTRELSKYDFNQFIEQVRQWSIEYLHTDIPEPNELTMLNI